MASCNAIRFASLLSTLMLLALGEEAVPCQGRAQPGCQSSQLDDEVALIQLTNSMVTRKKEEIPPVDLDSISSGVIKQELDLTGAVNSAIAQATALRSANGAGSGHGPVNVTVVMGIDQGAPSTVSPFMPGMTTPPMPYTGQTTFVPEPAWVTGAPVSSTGAPLPPMMPAMGGGIGNITIVISPPLSVDPDQPAAGTAGNPTTFVPANMVVGYVPPTTGVPVSAVVGYAPPAPPTVAPLPMPAYPYPPPMPAYPPPMPMAAMPPAPLAFTAVPVSAYDAGAGIPYQPPMPAYPPPMPVA